jgi:ribosomal protein L31
MAKIKYVEGEHPFTTAGFGLPPFQDTGNVIYSSGDERFVCEACKQNNLKEKFEVKNLSHAFWVGNECIKKCDPDLILEMAHKYGSNLNTGNITRSQVNRRKMYDDGNAIVKLLIETYPNLTRDIQYQFKHFMDWESNSKRQSNTWVKWTEELKQYHSEAKAKSERRAEQEESSRLFKERIALMNKEAAEASDRRMKARQAETRERKESLFKEIARLYIECKKLNPKMRITDFNKYKLCLQAAGLWRDAHGGADAWTEGALNDMVGQLMSYRATL